MREFDSRIDGNDVQFSLDAVPNSMQADMIATQAEVMENIQRFHHGLNTQGGLSEDPVARNERTWNQHPRMTVKVSQLERYSKDNTPRSAQVAVTFLTRRTKVALDDVYTIPSSDPSLVWKVNDHYLDHMACIPAKQGLAVCLRSGGDYLGFRVYLDFLSSYRAISFKHTFTDFNPSGRCCFLGRYNTDQLWAVFVCDAFFEDNDNESSEHAYNRHNGDGSALPLSAYDITEGDTRLSPIRVQIWQLFWCHLLTAISWRGVSLVPKYRWGTSVDVRSWQIKDICNLL